MFLAVLRFAFIVLALIGLAGVLYPVPGMSPTEAEKGKTLLGGLFVFFAVLAWLTTKPWAKGARAKARKTGVLTPYKVEDVGDGLVYEYKTAYLYAMYLFLAILAAGYLLGSTWLSALGALLLVFYFLEVSFQYRKVRSVTRNADPDAVSGSKWSFSDPLRIKIPSNPN